MNRNVALCDLFSQQALATPNAIALSTASEQVTYRVLHNRAIRVATRLRSVGVGRDTMVGIFLNRSIDMVAALLGVWYAGGAYVPLDPEYPTDRLAFMAADAGLTVLLTERTLASRAPATKATPLMLDDVTSDATGEPVGPFPDSIDDEALAYVIYTSGSTGRPKGVEIPRRAVRNFLQSMRRQPGIAAGDVLVALTTLSFDIAVLELFLPLTVGASAVIVSAEVAADGSQLRATLDASHATMMQATPATWRMLLDAGWDGHPAFTALCGGEALTAELARELGECVETVWNMYGPTETTVWSTCYRLPSPDAPVLLGRPIECTGVYVLDKWHRPTPVGVPGEIYITGAGLARGYRNLPDLTAERFVPDPHAAGADGRMYRTGDLGRYLNDGNIEYRGRVDNQVKVRGFRIELGEVEAVLMQHPSVQTAAVVVQRYKPDDARLIAYLVARPGAFITTADVRDHLRTLLPAYMIPQHYVTLDAMPLTPNRKVDRQRLPPIDTNTLPEPEAFVAPESATERAVAEAWRSVLGIERISATATFFDLGGHSILAARIVAQLRREFRVGLTLRHLFEAPTVAGIARHIDALSSVTAMGGHDLQQAGEREEMAF